MNYSPEFFFAHAIHVCLGHRIIIPRPLKIDHRLSVVYEITLVIDKEYVMAERAGRAFEAPGASHEDAFGVPHRWVTGRGKYSGERKKLIPVCSGEYDHALGVECAGELPEA